MTYNDLPRPKPLPKGWWRQSCTYTVQVNYTVLKVDIYGVSRPPQEIIDRIANRLTRLA